MISFHDNPQNMNRLGKNGRLWAKSIYTKELYGNEMEELFLELKHENDN